MKEEQIRKRETFNKYLKLAKEDSEKFFADKTSFVNMDCPACSNKELVPEFEKHGFRYVSCSRCNTLFVNPRPPFKQLNDFYADSLSSRFWINEFFKPVASLRQEKIFKPRAEYVDEMFSGKKIGTIGDAGAGFGLFLEELRKVRPESKFIAIEPSLEQADICRVKNLEVRCCALEEIKDSQNSFDLLTAFELLEHLFAPRGFLKHIHSMLKPQGHFLFTTLNGLGFDIQLLWQDSKSIHPPHHLNFFNTESIVVLLKDCGFEAVELSTPGKLDWDIVEGMIRNETCRPGRFWESFANKASEQSKQELQSWIAGNGLSSHMRVLARKI